MIDNGKKVFVYRNLHKNMFSVRSKGKVIAHTRHLLLKDVRYCVGQKGRERVLRTKQKNVHAGVRGTVISDFTIVPLVLPDSEHVSYNPYENSNFVKAGVPIERSNFALLTYVNDKPVIYAIMR